MRIKEPHTSPGIEVLEDEVPEQGTLAESRLPDDIQVLRPVLGMKEHKFGLVRDPERPGANGDRGVVHGKGARPLFPSPWGASVLPIGRTALNPCLEVRRYARKTACGDRAGAAREVDAATLWRVVSIPTRRRASTPYP